MTDTNQDICRVMAEQIYYADCHKIKSLFQKGGLPENIQSAEIKELLEILIRDNTIVPEMVSMLEVVEYELSQPLSGKLVLSSQISKLLAKAGRK